ncbi:MAG: hypothetical protein U5K54_02740 [Cytophagales bacterium]|nr:hypothetical protein [Cytophagales bacterium]
MDIKSGAIESLLARAEQYNKASLELLKLKSIDKTGDILSTLISRSFLTIAISFFLFTLTVAISLWLGELIGKSYMGFLIVTLFYALVGTALLLIHPKLKSKIYDSIIAQMLN